MNHSSFVYPPITVTPPQAVLTSTITPTGMYPPSSITNTSYPLYPPITSEALLISRPTVVPPLSPMYSTQVGASSYVIQESPMVVQPASAVMMSVFLSIFRLLELQKLRTNHVVVAVAHLTVVAVRVNFVTVECANAVSVRPDA